MCNVLITNSVFRMSQSLIPCLQTRKHFCIGRNMFTEHAWCCWRCYTDFLDVPRSDCTISRGAADCGTAVPEVRMLSWILLQVHQPYHPSWQTNAHVRYKNQMRDIRVTQRTFHAYLCVPWGFCRYSLLTGLSSSSSLSGIVAGSISSMSDSRVHFLTQQGYRKSSAAGRASWGGHRTRAFIIMVI